MRDDILLRWVRDRGCGCWPSASLLSLEDLLLFCMSARSAWNQALRLVQEALQPFSALSSLLACLYLHGG